MWWRALLVWLLIMAVETVLGTLRQLVLVPALGGGPGADLAARKIGVFVGMVMIFAITWLCIRWMIGNRTVATPSPAQRQGALAPLPGLRAEFAHTPVPAAKAPTLRAHARSLLCIGAAWAALTLTFEIGIGRLMAMTQEPDGGWAAVWMRLGDDYDPTRGGFMTLGLTVLALAPLAGARLRKPPR